MLATVGRVVPVSSPRSTRTPSMNLTPARTSGTSSAPLSLRHDCSAVSSSLKTMASPAAREPGPFVTRVRRRTVANADSMGLVVRRCFQCSAGKSKKAAFWLSPCARVHAFDGLARRDFADVEDLLGCFGPEVVAELGRIYAVVDQLSTQARLVLLLRRVDGYSLPEIARMFGCSLSTAKRRMLEAERALLAYHQGGA